MGRDMHWLRWTPTISMSVPAFPRAPACIATRRAAVCRSPASIHDSEGLNAQVYNRCVGTRFSSRIVPTRCAFNFFATPGQEYANWAPRCEAVFNRMSQCAPAASWRNAPIRPAHQPGAAARGEGKTAGYATARFVHRHAKVRDASDPSISSRLTGRSLARQ